MSASDYITFLLVAVALISIISGWLSSLGFFKSKGQNEQSEGKSKSNLPVFLDNFIDEAIKRKTRLKKVNTYNFHGSSTPFKKPPEPKTDEIIAKSEQWNKAEYEADNLYLKYLDKLNIKGKKRERFRKNYDKYLRSEEWQIVRSTILARANYRCEKCQSRPAEQVHHIRYPKSYERMDFAEDNDLSYLVALCGKCHSSIHKFHGEDNQSPLGLH